MRTIEYKMRTIGTDYLEIVEKAEKKISAFFNIPLEDIANKVHMEVVIFETSDDGVGKPIHSAEVFAKLKS